MLQYDVVMMFLLVNYEYIIINIVQILINDCEFLNTSLFK